MNQIIGVIKERNEDQTSVNSKMVMSKVVLKHSKNSPDILIGKVTGSNKLLLRRIKKIGQSEIRIACGGHVC